MSNPVDLQRQHEERINQVYWRRRGDPHADFVNPFGPGESAFFIEPVLDKEGKPIPDYYLKPNQTGTYRQAVGFFECPDGKYVNSWNHWQRPAGLGAHMLSYRSAYTNPGTGQQKFFCDCGASFTVISARNLHERTQHGIRAFEYR
jgi:hypothetical protein